MSKRKKKHGGGRPSVGTGSSSGISPKLEASVTQATVDEVDALAKLRSWTRAHTVRQLVVAALAGRPV